MIKTLKTTSVVVAATLLSAPAHSDDWTGFYVGLNAGYASAAQTTDFGLERLQTGVAVFPHSRSLSPDGFLGGFEAGHDWQSSNLVFGIAADLQFGSLRDDAVVTPSPNYDYDTTSDTWEVLPPGISSSFHNVAQDIDWLMTFRGRAGFSPRDGLLLYATAGLALAEIKYSSQLFYFADNEYLLSETKTKIGLTVGAGGEIRVGGNWTVKGEYLYAHFDGESLTGSPGGTTFLSAITADFRDTSVHIGRIGINYRF